MYSQNIDSNEYTQPMFWPINMKMGIPLHTPVYIKAGYKEGFIALICFPDD